jgi:hypothetical protein
VFKLYLSRCHFLCRLCGRLVYTSKYGQPWQRASWRAHQLRLRLGIVGAVVPEKPNDVPVPVYARLLDAALRAETQATEACTARLQQLAARIGKPKFIL